MPPFEVWGVADGRESRQIASSTVPADARYLGEGASPSGAACQQHLTRAPQATHIDAPQPSASSMFCTPSVQPPMHSASVGMQLPATHYSGSQFASHRTREGAVYQQGQRNGPVQDFSRYESDATVDVSSYQAPRAMLPHMMRPPFMPAAPSVAGTNSMHVPFALQQFHMFQSSFAAPFAMDTQAQHGGEGSYAHPVQHSQSAVPLGVRPTMETSHLEHKKGRAVDMRSLTELLTACPPTQDVVAAILYDTKPPFRPRLPGLTKIMSRLSKSAGWQKALYIYDTLPLLGILPDTTITNAAIAACNRGGAWSRAHLIYEQMVAKGLKRDAITYSTVISALSKSKQWQLSLQIFQQMRAEGINVDAITGCTAISAMDKANKWELAEQIFLCMYHNHPSFRALARDVRGVLFQKEARHPDGSILLGAHLLAGSDPSGDSYLRAPGPYRSLSPGDRTTSPPGALDDISTRLLHMHLPPEPRQPQSGKGSAGYLTSAWPHMSEGDLHHGASLAPSSQSFDSLSAGGHPDGAGQFSPTHPQAAGAIQRKKRKHSSIRVCINALLTAYVRAHPPQHARAIRLLSMMISGSEDVQPDNASFKLLITAFADAGQPREALYIYDLALHHGNVPTQRVLTALMACAAKGGMPEAVQRLWQDMQLQDMQPSVASANQLLAALIHQGRLEAASAHFGSMLAPASAIAPNDESVKIMVDGLAEYGSAEMIVDTLQHFQSASVPSSVQVTNLLLKAYCQLGQWHEATNALTSAVNEGRADSQSLLLLLEKLLLHALPESTAFKDDSFHQFVLSLQWTALESCMRGGIMLTTQIIEIATTLCATAPTNARVAQLSDTTIFELFLLTMSRKSGLSGAAAGNILRACLTPSRSVCRRLVAEAAPALQSTPLPSTDHCAVLLAACCIEADLGALHGAVEAMSMARPSGNPRNGVTGPIAANCQLSHLSTALLKAAQALSGIGEHGLAEDIVRGTIRTACEELQDGDLAALAQSLHQTLGGAAGEAPKAPDGDARAHAGGPDQVRSHQEQRGSYQ